MLLCGGGLGNAVLFSIARALQRQRRRVLYFAGYQHAQDIFKRDEIEAATDQVIWSVDKGSTPSQPRRPQDRAFSGNIVQAMVAYARAQLGDAAGSASATCDRIIAIGSDRMMAAVQRARATTRSSALLQPDHAAIGSINSPMQCMMKEICAQCLCKHRDPVTGKETFVFSCFNQDQPHGRDGLGAPAHAVAGELAAGEAVGAVAGSSAGADRAAAGLIATARQHRGFYISDAARHGVGGRIAGVVVPPLLRGLRIDVSSSSFENRFCVIA